MAKQQLNALVEKLRDLPQKQKMIAGGIACAVLLALGASAMGVKLPGFGGTAEQSLNRYPIQDEAGFVALTEVYHVEPPKAPSFTFDIKLPKDWEVENMTTDVSPDFSRRIIGEIARIRSPYYGIYRPEVVVQTVELQHDMEAAKWLQHYTLSNSYILQGKVDALSTYRAQASYTYIKENTVMLVQIAVVMNGREAVLARFEMPLAFKEQMGFLQKRAIETFHLSAGDEKPVEEQKPFTLADVLKFNYPASWRPSPPDLRDMNRIGLQIVNKSPSGIFNGFIQVFIVARSEETNLLTEAERLRAYVKDILLLNITEMTGTRPMRVHDKFIFTRDETYRARSLREGNIAPQELRLAVLGTEDRYFLILMLSPEESKDLYNWARNQRSFDLILGSMQ